MDEGLKDTLRILIALALTGLLVLLRLDAQRFGAAEYDEPMAGQSWLQAWSRRLAWYALGIGLVVAILVIHPSPSTDLRLAVGDRAGGIFLGIVLGLAGVVQALGLAWYHYRRIRLPDPAIYPGAISNEVITAFIDEATFRGAVLGFLLWGGVDPNLAILTQAIAYTLATRAGAPGRDRYMFVLTLAIGLVAGWATVATNGIAAAFLGHAMTRVAVFLVTGHAGSPVPRGRGFGRRREAPHGARRLVTGRADAIALAPALGVEAVARPPIALYLHVPFCVSICPYCDFVVVAGSAARGPRSSVARYLRAVEAELDLRADALDDAFGPPGTVNRPPLASLYLGGGTPSLLPAPAIGRLVDVVRRRLGLAPAAEVTIEANPGPDERGDPSALRVAGITRLSIGAQSMDDAELRRLGRRHRPGDTAAAVAAARAAGISSVSLDLLYDVPGQTVAAFERGLEAALSLSPDHMSLYALTLDDPAAEGLTGPIGDHLPSSPGALRWRAAARARQDDDRAAAMYELASERLAAVGFRGYEISNWARPGHESRHNLAYWQREPHEAAGPGAHAFDGAQRRWNAASLAGYLAALDSEGGSTPHRPPGDAETLDPQAAAAERTILSLRLDTGVSAEEATDGPLGPHLEWALQAGLLASSGEGRFALTTRGRLLSNELFARLV